MYFKRLEIFGFKSFADKTVLNFEPGITAVVGPNGCGKSNIFDAIRWVLGEQSIKELRGSAMEDVIFNGTDKKPALGFAEVSCTFSNESRVLPIEYDEVTITRRLFRSGESEYLLNKTVVRLKDILELLMGTGIGSEAYSLVQQGRVDLIVSARPEDRRIIIDEAAGITKYKSKKKEALNKLKDTENNLLRINDIILEVKRQISSLERQATKARRYKETFEKLKDAEVHLARYQLGLYRNQEDEIQRSLNSYKDQEADYQTQAQQLNEDFAKESEAAQALEHKGNEITSEDLKIENQIEINTRQIQFDEERIEELRNQKARLEQQKAQLTQQSLMQEEKIKSLQEALMALGETTRNNNILVEEKRLLLNKIAQDNREAKDAIRHHEEQIFNLTTDQVNLKNEQTEVMKEFQGCLARKRRLEMEFEKVSCEKAESDNRLKTVNEDIDRYQSKIDDLKGKKEIKIAEVGELKDHLMTIEDNIRELEKRRLFLKSQKEFIEELRVQYQDIPDPVIDGTLLTTHPPQENHTGIIGKVKNVTVLNQDKLNLLKSHFPHYNGANLYEIICESKFIELDPQHIIAKMDELTQGIEQAVSQKEILVQDVKEKEDVIASLTHSVHDVEKILSSFEAIKNDILSEVNKLNNELDLANQELSEAKESMRTLKRKEDELIARLTVIEEGIEVCQEGIKEKRNLISQKAQEKEEATVTIAQLETELESAGDQEKSLNENLQMFQDAKTDNAQDIQRIDQEMLGHDQKKLELEQNIINLRSSFRELGHKRESLKHAFADYEQKKADIVRTLHEMNQKSAQLEEGLRKIQESIHGQALKSQETLFQEKSIKDRLVQTYKINVDEWPQSCEKVAQPSPAQDQEQTVCSAGTEDAAKEFNPEECQQEIEALQKRCENYGAVNLVAIDEFDALRERFEFLTKQQCDLITAQESLHKTISKINRTTRQMFMDTFIKVSEEFRIYFRMLFGGGEAQLILVDPENVLESGIEIIARPPGKKLQNIMLLSGGEKSLAAIALIFGVFKVNPSPFCILDEIDAALDEANVGRFSYLLKDFCKIAQFIVITHNKKTIVNANVMYGITMQESGVSRIVSVKLANQEEEMKEAEVPAGVS
ncbi:MAG: AAA family ATPase [Candidatus Omnitrophota bacterium]